MAAAKLALDVGVQPACAALGVSRATYYRRQSPPRPQQPRPTPARALSQTEREDVLVVLDSDRFVDSAPEAVHAALLDDGRYLCSPRTMYRLLNDRAPVRERRNQLRHPDYKKPELVAEAPNEVWSWDITKLLGPKKWTYYYLYVLLDIFSRYVVGWMVADRENSALASRLITETCAKHGVEPTVLTLHSDRGSPMTSKCTAQMLADLGVIQSLSRPQVSDDNPFSEAQFKTLKYRPGFPGASTTSPPRTATAGASSPGTTTNIATAASPCSPQATSTTARPTRSSRAVRQRSPRPTPPTPSASPTDRQRSSRCRTPSISTRPTACRARAKPRLSKSSRRVSQYR